MGENHVCATLHDHSLICWGDNTYGQTSFSRLFKRSQTVGAGNNHSCALSLEGILGCWGTDSDIDGKVAGILEIPEEALGIKVKMIVGPFHNFVISFVGADGKVPTNLSKNINGEYDFDIYDILVNVTIIFWGLNNNGQTDLPAPLQSYFPYTRLTDLTTGLAHSCAIYDSKMICWGNDSYNQCTPPMKGGFRMILHWFTHAGWYHNCSLCIGGVMVCWGSNDFGEAAVPVYNGMIGLWSTGGNHNCMRLEGDRLHCWGNNNHSQCDVPSYAK